jgi:hypothetical protein
MTNTSSGLDPGGTTKRRPVAATPAETLFGVTTAGAVVAALAGTVAGPGGVVAGAVVGGLFGRGIVKLLYPTTNDVFLRQTYWSRP